VDIAFRVGVGIILLAAGAAKLRARAELPDTLRGYGIGEPLTRPAAVGLVTAEVALGALLVSGLAPLPVTLAAVVLGLVFAGAVLRVRAQGVRRLRCGCFGSDEHTTGFLLVRAVGFTALAGLAAAATAYGAPDLSRENVLVIAVVVLTLVVATLAALLLALYRQVGLLTLRMGPAQGALELPGEGPELAANAPPLEGLLGRGSELIAFFSPSCRLCRELLPAVQALGREGVAISIVDEGENPEAFRCWNVPGSPFAVHVVDGVVTAKGLVNTLEQLEGLVEIGTARSVRAAA
jgi:hypothetical protein